MPTPAQIVVLPPGGARLEVQEVLLSDPGPYEVLVRQYASGICHSQLDHIAGADPDQPLILGHESSGVVIQTGSQVRHVTAGDEVLITWIARDRSRVPNPVRISLYDGTETGTRNVFTWATHTLADEQFVVKVPSGLPGDLTSIIGCAIMTGSGAVLNTADPEPGSSVAVWGAGGVGLSAVAAARNVGASTVIAVDIAPEKLALAQRLGADMTLNALETNVVDEIRRVTIAGDGTSGVDYSIDCTGLSNNLRNSVEAVRPGVLGVRTGGSTILVGAIRGNFELPGMELINGQKSLVGCFGGGCHPDRDFPIFVNWFIEGRLDLEALVTNRYTLDEVSVGVDDLRSGRIAGRGIIEF
jgi:S-(hydroxymethyl)glutathione dehydrogenase/alcohol dehydrogenase